MGKTMNADHREDWWENPQCVFLSSSFFFPPPLFFFFSSLALVSDIMWAPVPTWLLERFPKHFRDVSKYLSVVAAVITTELLTVTR